MGEGRCRTSLTPLSAQPGIITIGCIWASRPTAMTTAARPAGTTANVAAERLGRDSGAARPSDTGRGSLSPPASRCARYPRRARGACPAVIAATELSLPAGTSGARAASPARAHSPAGRQRLQVETSLSAAPVLGDPDLIRRLADNLLDNAVHHNCAGGTVRLATGRRNGHVTLSVANTGPVIPPAEVARLFRPFERLATTRTGNGDGHGLGLSIVAAIAAAHSAEITTDARPEGGLRIEVSFPAGNHVAPH